MNEFQNQLQKVISEINKASQRVVLSERIEQIDLDVLLERIRKAYCLVIDLGIEQEEIPAFAMPASERIVEKADELEELVIEEENSFEPKVEDIKEIVAEQEIEQEVEQEQEIEEEFEEEIEEEEIEEEEEEEEVQEQQEEKEIVKHEFQEQLELIIEPEPKIEKLIQEDLFDQVEIQEIPSKMFENEPENNKDEIPSVLKYLNEQMPKVSTLSPFIPSTPKQESEPIIDEPKIDEPKIDETPSAPLPTTNGKSIGELYEQKKSVFENISTKVKQDDVSKRFSSRVDLRTAIGVNEKFMFITDLFSGNLREYTDFIQRLNDAENEEMANEILNSERENKRWVSSSLSYTTLMEILAKKFHR